MSSTSAQVQKIQAEQGALEKQLQDARWAEALGLPLADIETAAAAAGGSGGVAELIMAAAGVPAVEVDTPMLPLDLEGKIHRVDPDFGSTLTASNRDSQSNCWVNLKIVGQPCEFQVRGLNACQLSFLPGVCESHHGLNARLRGLWAPDSSLQQWVAMQRAMAAASRGATPRHGRRLPSAVHDAGCRLANGGRGRAVGGEDVREQSRANSRPSSRGDTNTSVGGEDVSEQ